LQALAGAAISLVKVLADPYDQLPAITFWQLGSLAGINANHVVATVPVVLVGLTPLFLLRWRISVLSLGDDDVNALGVEVARLRTIIIAAAMLITASVVAISGVVSWSGSWSRIWNACWPDRGLTACCPPPSYSAQRS
jgi:iron complex transport system permease protein